MRTLCPVVKKRDKLKGFEDEDKVLVNVTLQQLGLSRSNLFCSGHLQNISVKSVIVVQKKSDATGRE